MKQLLRDLEVESVMRRGRPVRMSFANNDEAQKLHAKAVQDQVQLVLDSGHDPDTCTDALANALEHLRALATLNGVEWDAVAGAADDKLRRIGGYDRNFVAHGKLEDLQPGELAKTNGDPIGQEA